MKKILLCMNLLSVIGDCSTLDKVSDFFGQSYWTPVKVSSIAPGALVGLSDRRFRAIYTEDKVQYLSDKVIESMSSQELRMLKSSFIKQLTPKQIMLINPKLFRLWSEKQLSAFTNIQWSSMSLLQLANLTKNQRNYITNKGLYAGKLPNELDIKAVQKYFASDLKKTVNVNVLEQFTEKAIKYLPINKITDINPKLFTFFTNEQLSAFSKNQWSAFNIVQLAHLNNAQRAYVMSNKLIEGKIPAKGSLYSIAKFFDLADESTIARFKEFNENEEDISFVDKKENRQSIRDAEAVKRLSVGLLN